MVSLRAIRHHKNSCQNHDGLATILWIIWRCLWLDVAMNQDMSFADSQKGPIQGSHWIVRGGFKMMKRKNYLASKMRWCPCFWLSLQEVANKDHRVCQVLLGVKDVMKSSRGTAFNATEICHLWEIHGTTVAFLWLTVSDFWVYHGRSSAGKWHRVFAPPCRWPMPRAPARKTGRPGRIWGAGEGTSRLGQESQVVHVGVQLVH